MSSDSNHNAKMALTSVVGIFFVCLLSESLVGGVSIGKATTSTASDLSDYSTNYELARYPENRNKVPVISGASGIKEGSGHHQINKPNILENSVVTKANGKFAKRSARSKRSPYPPGFVAWTWKEHPCFCPPGQFFSCRCNYSNSSSQVGSDSDENNKLRKRRSRSKKLKTRKD